MPTENSLFGKWRLQQEVFNGTIKIEKNMLSFGLGDILTCTNLMIFIYMAGIKDSGLDTVSTNYLRDSEGDVDTNRSSRKKG